MVADPIYHLPCTPHNLLKKSGVQKCKCGTRSEFLQNAGGENVWDTFARSEANEPRQGRGIFQQENIRDWGKVFRKIRFAGFEIFWRDFGGRVFINSLVKDFTHKPVKIILLYYCYKDNSY